MKKILLQTIILTIFLGNSFVILPDKISAHEHAERTHNNIIHILRTKNNLYEEDSDLFVQEISDAFSPIVDFKRIARNVMGKHYNSSTISQREKFTEAFRASLLNTYSKTLIEFKDERIIVLPFFLTTFAYAFPIKSSGSFFTTNNAVIIFLTFIFGGIVSLLGPIIAV